MSLRRNGYWDQQYEEELKNFLDHGDYGYVWYGKPLTRRIVKRILQELKDNSGDKVLASIDVLDVGCGNAFLLATLVEKSLECLPTQIIDRLQLHGIDYSEKSIELSRKIVESEERASQIHLQQCDFLNLNQVRQIYPDRRFDFIVDKGTFDAICLLRQDAVDQVREEYRNSILALAKSGTILVLASCNYGEEELMGILNETSDTEDRLYFRLLDKIETPKIKFGGQEGSQVTCLVIKFE